MEDKQRGNCENLEHLNLKFQKILNRPVNKTEVKLFPYLIHCLMDQEIDRRKLSSEEQKLIKDYIEKGLLIKASRTIGCSKEFWTFLTDVTYDKYVIEL